MLLYGTSLMEAGLRCTKTLRDTDLRPRKRTSFQSREPFENLVRSIRDKSTSPYCKRFAQSKGSYVFK